MASAGADVAATDRPGRVVMAALALPGVLPGAALGQGAPTDGLVQFKLLRYEDSQPGLNRITVNSPSLFIRAPIDSRWAAEGSLVVDSLSGATPRWHSSVSSASVMRDRRTAGDVKVTHYRDRSAWSAGLAHSSEDDFRSTAISADASLSSDDNNRTWTLGLAWTRDFIDATDGGWPGDVRGRDRKTAQLLLGVTQVWSRQDVVQLNASVSVGRGDYSDPYKAFDARPDRRDQFALLGRWNHAFDGSGLAAGATWRSSWRYYRDSFGIGAHTLQAEWVQPVWGSISSTGTGSALALTPLLRYHTQNAARFYRDALPDPTLLPLPPGYDPLNPGPFGLNSYDHRLSAFGAVTLGLKAEWRLDDWTFDLKGELYRQRSEWRLGGEGSPGLAPLTARIVQVGVARRF